MGYQILMYLVLILSTGGLSRNAKIIGGEEADPSEFPYHVTIELNGRFLCGGSIIGVWYVITAGHCVHGPARNKETLRVYTECSRLEAGSFFTIDGIFIYPRFTALRSRASMFEHDLAVVKIKEAIDSNRCQRMVELPREDVSVPSVAVVSGWGTVSYPANRYPSKLQKATMSIINNHECASKVSFVLRSSHLCALNATGIGVCEGDSGSGLVSNGKIVGVASFVRPCATGQPDIYTRIYPHLDFIKWVIS